jgi:hypothetical protein
VMVDLAEKDGDYNLVMASDTAETAYEWSVSVAGEDLRCGMLSGALYTVLQSANDLNHLTYRQWINEAIRITQAASSGNNYPGMQTPLFIGDGAQGVFGSADPYLDAFEFSQRKTWEELSVQQLKRRYRNYTEIYQINSPGMYAAFGKAFRTKGDFKMASKALLDGMARFEGEFAGLARESAFIELLGGNIGAAREHWDAFAALSPSRYKDEIETISSLLGNLAGYQPHIKLFLLNVSRKELEAPVPEDVDPEFEEIKEGRFSWVIERLQKVLVNQFGEGGFDLQIYPKEGLIPFQDEKARLALQFPDNQPSLVCIFGMVNLFLVSTSLPDQFIQAMQEAVKDKPVFIWVQGDPKKTIPAR